MKRCPKKRQQKNVLLEAVHYIINSTMLPPPVLTEIRFQGSDFIFSAKKAPPHIKLSYSIITI